MLFISLHFWTIFTCFYLDAFHFTTHLDDFHLISFAFHFNTLLDFTSIHFWICPLWRTERQNEAYRRQAVRGAPSASICCEGKAENMSAAPALFLGQ
jgi:hypothetical protein